MAKVAIIQLCRVGDIISVLPVAKALADEGHAVTFYVAPGFESVLDGVSYADYRLHDTTHRDVLGATERAKREGFDRIIAAQVDGNPAQPPHEVTNFILNQWTRCRMADRFHDLPLIFDRRDLDAEAEAVAKWLPPGDDRPVIGHNFHGHSSPYRWNGEQRDWLEENFGKTHRLLNFGAIKLPKVHHLLGLLERCEVLWTIDTMTLHLAYATMTPTLAMSAGKTPNGQPSAYYDSEPRAHWVFRCSYDQSIAGETRREIARIIRERDYAPGRLCRQIPAYRFDRIWHVMDWHLGGEDDTKRIRKAQRNWEHLLTIDPRYKVELHTVRQGQRTSRSELGDTRELPYIKDVIDRGAARAQDDDDIVVWSNCDVALVPEATDEIRRKLARVPCCFSRRVDVFDGGQALTIRDLMGKEPGPGVDLFAFRAGWWKAHRDEVPDALSAAEGFDFCLRWIMRRYTAEAEMKPPIIYHERHDSYWSRKGNLLTNPAQRYNRELCGRWAIDNGFADALWGETCDYLFKPDYAFKVPAAYA